VPPEISARRVGNITKTSSVTIRTVVGIKIDHGKKLVFVYDKGG
jgi:hypothetical protein